MEKLFVHLLYLMRPTLNAELFGWRFLGFGFFELAAILLFLFLAAGFSLKLMQKERDPVSRVEMWAVLLIVWCTISYLVHIDISHMSNYVKFILPPLTYVLLKRILPDRSVHVRMIFLMLVGFLIPFVFSAVMTYQGEGLAKTIYWTGTERYKGIYANIHSMGHNAGFAMMLTIVYLVIKMHQKLPRNRVEVVLLAAVFLMGAYLVYASQTRNVYLGVLLFFLVVLFFYSKRALTLFIFCSIVFVAYFWDSVSTIFFDFVDPQYAGENFERVGSGRYIVWARSLDAWRHAPFLHQLTGMGIGNFTSGTGRLEAVDATLPRWGDPHNDWLFVLMSLGLVGFFIFVGFFVAIFRTILMIPGREKFAFLGVFIAVLLMSLTSNSYLSRVTMAQMFFMLMVYMDLKTFPVVRPSVLGARLGKLGEDSSALPKERVDSTNARL